MSAYSHLQIEASDSPMVRSLKAQAVALLSTLPPEPEVAFGIVGRKLDYFSAAALRIKPKETEGGLAPFVFNAIQHDYLAGLRLRHRLRPQVDVFRGIRDVILKPRQLGFTTFIAALFFLDGLLHPGRNSLVLTHLDKISQEVLRTYKTFFECLLPEFKQTVRLKRNSALHLELEFLGPDGLPDPIRFPSSTFMVATAEGLDIRGITIHNLHGSEAAFYGNWSELVRGVFQAVPHSGNIILESTANGFNHYKDLVDSALENKGRYRLVFYPWHAHAEYSAPVSDEIRAQILSPHNEDEDEIRLIVDGVTPEQLKWRRDKLEEMGGMVDSFRQEYPGNVQDAFIASGRPVFNLRTVAGNWDLARRVVPERPEPNVEIYAPWEEGMVCILVADPAEGIDKGEGDPVNEIGGTDYSSGFIIDVRNLRTLAHIHGRMEPVPFAALCAKYGSKYDAMIAVERNNHGHLVLYALEEAGYPDLYRHTEYDASGQSFQKLGFPMTTATRPLVIQALGEVIRRNALPCPCARFWAEALVFVRNPAGKEEAMPKRHDDRVMSMAIGVYLATIGAKAWGGSGIMENADSAGLPMPKGARANLPKPAPAPPPQGPLSGIRDGATHPLLALQAELRDVEPMGRPEESPILAATLDARIKAEDGLDPSTPAPLAQVALSRAESIVEGYRCGNCGHMCPAQWETVCALPPRFRVRPEDPACPSWIPEEGAAFPGYTDDSEPINFGGL